MVLGQRGAPRRSSPRRRCTCTGVPEKRMILGYLFPTGPTALAAMHEIAASEASPSVTRVSDANETRSRSRRGRRRRPLDRVKSTALDDVPRGAVAASTSKQMCLVVHRLRGQRGARRRAAQARRARSSAATAGCASGPRPGELYDQKKFDTPVHPRLPARPRRARRTCRRPRRRGARLPTLYDDVMAAAQRRVRRARRAAATSCATCRTPTTRAPASTSRSRFKPARSARRARAVRRRQVARSSRRSSTRARTLSHHHAVGTEHAPLARGGHLGAGRRDAARAVRRHRPGREPEPGQDRLCRLAVASRARRCRPSRARPTSARRRRRAGAGERRRAGSDAGTWHPQRSEAARGAGRRSITDGGPAPSGSRRPSAGAGGARSTSPGSGPARRRTRARARSAATRPAGRRRARAPRHGAWPRARKR